MIFCPYRAKRRQRKTHRTIRKGGFCFIKLQSRIFALTYNQDYAEQDSCIHKI